MCRDPVHLHIIELVCMGSWNGYVRDKVKSNLCESRYLFVVNCFWEQLGLHWERREDALAHVAQVVHCLLVPVHPSKGLLVKHQHCTASGQ